MRAAVALLACIAACGDNAAPGPLPLVPDPAVVTGCAPGPLPAHTTRAKVVACREELIGGRLAGGRVGDFVLENSHVRVIVRGPGEGYFQHGTSGGGIVDAAPVGGEDLVKELVPVVDLAVGAFDELVITEAGDTGPAELVVRGPASPLDIITAALAQHPPPVIVEQHYRLAADADELELETRTFLAGSEPASPQLYDAMFMGGRVHAFMPGRGYPTTGGAGAEMIAFEGTTSSYAIVYPPTQPNPQLIDLSQIRLVQGPLVDAIGVKRWFVIGDGSVASVTARGWALRGQVLGIVSGTTAPGASVVFEAGGVPMTVARADATGAYHAALPPGQYLAHSEQLGHVSGGDVAVTIAASSATTAAIPDGPSGTLTVTVKDEVATPLPARILIEADGHDRRVEWTGASGTAQLALEPGTWRISISRGLEYDAFVASALVVADGQTQALDVTLDHVVDTAGWISLDTHLHSELSTDSTFPIDDRLRAVAGEGVEVPVSSDHDFITDYAPIIAELGLGDWLGSLTGDEASSIIWGHINAWPLVPDASRTGQGAVHWLARSPGDVFAALRAGDPKRVVQVNHPRLSAGNLFEAVDLDPTTLTAHRDPTLLGLPATTDLSDLSFDAVEVANGLSRNQFDQVFADYLALVTAGHPAAATGSSDSHSATGFAGEARTFVWVGTGADHAATIDADTIDAAIHARHVVVGTGAFVTAGIVTAAGTSLPGDTVDVAGAPNVKLHIRVQAPPWQPLASIRIFERTQQVLALPLDIHDTTTVRFDADVTLPTPTGATFYVVRVDRGGRGDPVLGEMMPAFTNPIFAHGD